MGAVAAAPLVGSARPAYRVEVATDWDEARARWAASARAGTATVFQCADVVEAWYRAMAAEPGLLPVVVSVTDAQTGARAIDLALLRRRIGVARVIAPADLDLVDFNAPILGPAAPTDRAGARALWRAIRRALPPADLVALTKQPPTLAGRPNPLALLADLPSRLNGNLLVLGEDFETYLRGTLKRTVRKEFERCWRVFQRQPDVRFELVAGAADRRAVLAAMERLQPARMSAVGKTYILDAPAAADFYRRLVEEDPAGERVALLALRQGDETIAALMGLRLGRGFTMVRICHSTDPVWANCSPGRLVILEALRHLHAEGLREFEFSVGNFDYKRRFGVEPWPMVDFVRALTPLGLPALLALRARAWLRERPDLEARARRWLGRTPMPQEAS